MAGIPEEQAGVGSAVNDVSRQLGAALGIAVLGSLMSGAYASAVTGVPGVPAAATELARESLAGAGVLLASAFGIHRALRPATATDEVVALERQLEAA